MIQKEDTEYTQLIAVKNSTVGYIKPSADLKIPNIVEEKNDIIPKTGITTMMFNEYSDHKI